MKKLLVVVVALSFVFGAKAWAEEGVKKAAPAKQAKIVEARINEGDLARLETAVDRAVKEAVIAKQGPSGFEYMAKRMKPPKSDKWQEKWNELGAEGWEAIDHFENTYIFKRAAVAAAASSTRLKPAPAPAKAEAIAVEEPKPTKEDKAAEKAAKKAEKEKEKAAKKAEKDAKKLEKEKTKAAKKAEKKK